MNYNEAIDFIHSVSNYFCKPGLSRISSLLDALGNPQDSLKYIHVAGTNGKGSFCAYLSKILEMAGYKVGRYTSPYILRFNERISINDTPISDDDLAELCTLIKNRCQEMTDKPTEFEVITAIGFEYFKRKECDIVILECGLGGRFDATNIINTPLISVITGIDYDHQAFLGDTIEQIAFEKAGIIKKNAPCLWCGENKIAEKVIKDVCQKQSSKLFFPDEPTIKTADLSGTKFDLASNTDLETQLLGLYQVKNAANAVKAAELINCLGFNIPKLAIKRGLKEAKWFARFEKLCDSPTVIFDGGHNPQGVLAATNSFKHYFCDKKAIVISGVMADKNYSFIVEKIGEIADRVFCITAPNPRALSKEAYAKEFEKIGITATASTVKQALDDAFLLSIKNDLPIICLGSLYMYSDIYDLIK